MDDTTAPLKWIQSVFASLWFKHDFWKAHTIKMNLYVILEYIHNRAV